MTKTKHTEGPWRENGLLIVDKDNRVIADVIWDQSGRGVGAHEINGNARLIASAPELLSVLQAVSDYLATAAVRPDPDMEADVTDRVRAAIAKARGES